MITASLRRAAPLLALLAALPIRASAQSDAAFAAALGQIAAPLAAAAKSKAKPQKPAAPKAPSAPDAVWQKVLEAVRNDGTYTPQLGPMPGSFTLEDFTGDLKAEYAMQGVKFVGRLNKDGKFEAAGAVLVSNKASLSPKDGSFNIDHWIIMTDVYGQVAMANHATAVRTPAGITVPAAKSNLSSAEVQAQYDAMLKHWAERKPK